MKQKDQNQELYAICRYLRLDSEELPEDVTEPDEKFHVLFETKGVMYSHIHLAGKWYQETMGPVLLYRGDGSYTALLPDALDRYVHTDPLTGKRTVVSPNNAALYSGEAVCFFRPLHSGQIGTWQLLRYCLQSLCLLDWIKTLTAVLLITLAGMITPFATGFLFSFVIPSGSFLALETAGILLVCAAVGTFLLSVFRSVCIRRISQKMSYALGHAVYARSLLSSADFYRKNSAGDLSNQIYYARQTGDAFCQIIFTSGASVLFSLFYLFQIFLIASPMLPEALLALAAVSAIYLFHMAAQIRHLKKAVKADVELNGFLTSVLDGIQKIRLSGSQDRVLEQWKKRYENKEHAVYRMSSVERLFETLAPLALPFIAGMIIYFIGSGALTAETYMIFQAAFAMAASGIGSLTGAAVTAAQIRSVTELIKPILHAVSEENTGKKLIRHLDGRIDIRDLSFRYEENGPTILNHLPLSLKPGEYVAVVGPSGCGKSTLLKLLLGMEKPHSGAVLYDGQDLEELDLCLLRRRIGTVLQSGKLFTGDIFSNIALLSPNLTREQAWEAAEMAGIAEDIRNMPMGMNTLLSEGGSNVSGGQRQRLLIARAIAGAPDILFFDEATSALDSISQEQITQTLQGMKCTRIVIAHRLSTIRFCDRIVHMENGRIVWEGTYEEYQYSFPGVSV